MCKPGACFTVSAQPRRAPWLQAWAPTMPGCRADGLCTAWARCPAGGFEPPEKTTDGRIEHGGERGDDDGDDEADEEEKKQAQHAQHAQQAQQASMMTMMTVMTVMAVTIMTMMTMMSVMAARMRMKTRVMVKNGCVLDVQACTSRTHLRCVLDVQACTYRTAKMVRTLFIWLVIYRT